MKYIITILLFLTATVKAQHTHSLQIKGDIAQPVTISFTDLNKYTVHEIRSLDILNHKMEFKKTLKNLKGVWLKDILSQVKFNASSPKELSTFYLVCIADDGYKVVYSWNELFNSATGKNAMIVTESDGVSALKKEEGVSLVTPGDQATGRRYVKNISEIIIHKAD